MVRARRLPPDGRDRKASVAVPHLTLTFLDSGLALDKADGEPVWDSGWDGLEEMSPVERSVLPDGRAGVVIVVVERGRKGRHRFVLATDDAAQHGGRHQSPCRRTRTAHQLGAAARCRAC